MPVQAHTFQQQHVMQPEHQATHVPIMHAMPTMFAQHEYNPYSQVLMSQVPLTLHSAPTWTMAAPPAPHLTARYTQHAPQGGGSQILNSPKKARVRRAQHSTGHTEYGKVAQAALSGNQHRQSASTPPDSARASLPPCYLLAVARAEFANAVATGNTVPSTEVIVLAKKLAMARAQYDSTSVLPPSVLKSLKSARNYAAMLPVVQSNAAMSESNLHPIELRWRVALEMGAAAKREHIMVDAHRWIWTAIANQPFAARAWLDASSLAEEAGDYALALRIVLRALQFCISPVNEVDSAETWRIEASKAFAAA